MKKVILSIMTVLTLLGCSGRTNYFDTYYNDEGLSSDEYIHLKANEKVRVVETRNLDATLAKYTKQGYVLIGTAYIKGIWEEFYNAIRVAEDKGATLVVVETEVIKTYKVKATETGSVMNFESDNSSGNAVGESTTYLTYAYDTPRFVQRAHFLALQNKD